MNKLQVRLLGTASVRVSGGTIEFLPDLRFQTLVYLAYLGDWVDRKRLAYLFWPDRTNAVARQNLRQLLRRLARFEWLQGLEVEPEAIRWSVETDVGSFFDAWNANCWEGSVVSYRGQLAPGLEGDRRDEFHIWLAGEREALHRRWRDAVFARSSGLAGQGSYIEAALLLRRLIDYDDVDEEALRAVMRALARAGQREPALHAFRQFGEKVYARFGGEPSSRSAALARAIAGEIESAADRNSSVAAAQGWGPISIELGSEPGSYPQSGPSGQENLPQVGREQELAEVARRISDSSCRLLNLKGPGGIGKSALAAAGLVRLVERYRGCVFLVPLTALGTVEEMAMSIAWRLGSRLQEDQDLIGQISALVGEQRLLLVLDGFEHMVQAASFVSRLLMACPGLDVIVTSRTRLGLREEWVMAVGGLESDLVESATGASDRSENGAQPAALRLLLARAEQLCPGLVGSLTPGDVEDLRRICKAVHSSPLALELAAEWFPSLTPASIAAELESGADLPSATRRDLAARHKSLRASFDHSWRLATPAEQSLIARLSVFGDRFTRPEALAVGAAPPELLASLVDKSLVDVLSGDGYRLYPLYSSFAREKLEQRPLEAISARERQQRFLSEAVRIV